MCSYAYNMNTLLQILILIKVVSTTEIFQVDFVYSNQSMRLSSTDHTEQFVDVFKVRNQIQCVQGCFTQSSGLQQYYALYKSEERVCVCKRDFDWRSFTLIASNEYEITRIEIREGLLINSLLMKESEKEAICYGTFKQRTCFSICCGVYLLL